MNKFLRNLLNEHIRHKHARKTKRTMAIIDNEENTPVDEQIRDGRIHITTDSAFSGLKTCLAVIVRTSMGAAGAWSIRV